MQIRSFTENDIAAILAIQRQCPQAAQWKPQDYLELAREPGAVILVANLEPSNAPEVAGFAAFHQVLDEAELRNLAVHPSHQRKGVASALLGGVILRLQESGAKTLYLEVRPSNQPARAFYSAAGFRLDYTRPNYYRNPAEDALVMALEISSASHPSRL